MENNQYNTNGLFDYYKNQVFKILGLFESKDVNGYRHGMKIRSEMVNLPEQFQKLYSDYRFNIVISKMDILIEELKLMDGEHQFVKNHVMESLNLLQSIKEGLQDENV